MISTRKEKELGSRCMGLGSSWVVIHRRSSMTYRWVQVGRIGIVRIGFSSCCTLLVAGETKVMQSKIPERRSCEPRQM
jgi:hypothetical protein